MQKNNELNKNKDDVEQTMFEEFKTLSLLGKLNSFLYVFIMAFTTYSLISYSRGEDKYAKARQVALTDNNKMGLLNQDAPKEINYHHKLCVKSSNPYNDRFLFSKQNYQSPAKYNGVCFSDLENNSLKDKYKGHDKIKNRKVL